MVRQPRCRSLTAFALSFGFTLVCGACEGAPTPRPSSEPAAASPMTWSSADGRLTVTMPGEYTAHVFSDAVVGALPDARFRIFVGYRPAGDLVPITAKTKDVLHARGWRLEGEQHFERASSLRLVRGQKRETSRTLWLMARRYGVVVCDGIAQPGEKVRLGEPHQRFCQSVRLRPQAGDATPAAPAPQVGK